VHRNSRGIPTGVATALVLAVLAAAAHAQVVHVQLEPPPTLLRWAPLAADSRGDGKSPRLADARSLARSAPPTA
jgi:hypothetical protein